jgi:hypothetical protein
MLEVVNVNEIYFIDSLCNDAFGGSNCNKCYRYLRYIILSVCWILVSFKKRVALETYELTFNSVNRFLC